MRLLFVADGRSPIALNWMRYFVEAGHEVHLASTYPCSPNLGFASVELVWPGMGMPSGPEGGEGGGWLRKLLPVGVRTLLRQWLTPAGLPLAGRRINALATRLQPDLVHAMRIPFEGILAALANPDAPLLLSVWGNDFTLHARANPWLAHLTRRCLSRAQALHTDCQRDQRLASAWGFPPDRPAIVLPGAGGVHLGRFYPAEGSREEAPLVIQPRGVRAYVRNDTFFRAIPLVLRAHPATRFLCPAMAGEKAPAEWLERLGIGGAVELLPRQDAQGMAALFRRAQVAVSITTHDGTPNTLLEAMACGCFPIAGDIETLREWIVPGANGLLVEPGDPEALARAILLALETPGLRRAARETNLRLVGERADYTAVMPQAEDFYRQLIHAARAPG
ncbi:MAG: glycosyltransferase family 4 protein [Anaerolineales bacterium]|nr:glycosyltransferase family 4 protein [Anaerolineales bacterium]